MLAGVTDGKATLAATNTISTQTPTSAPDADVGDLDHEVDQGAPHAGAAQQVAQRPVGEGHAEPGQAEEAERDPDPGQAGDEVGRHRVGAALDDLVGSHGPAVGGLGTSSRRLVPVTRRPIQSGLTDRCRAAVAWVGRPRGPGAVVV